MQIICYSGIKGGVAKSSMAILTANYLMALGYKVLCIDLDIQNSLTFYYFPELAESNKNISVALTNNDIKSNIISQSSVNIIPSSLNLVNLRTINIKTLSRLRSQIENNFDFVIVDTAPTFDNIVLNALCFSDYIITPTYLSLFDYKAVEFYKTQIEIETDKINNWKILLNKYKEPKTDNSESELNQYINLFHNNFNNIMQTKIYETSYIQKAIDTKIHITKAKAKEKLYHCISSLIKELLNIQEEPEQF